MKTLRWKHRFITRKWRKVSVFALLVLWTAITLFMSVIVPDSRPPGRTTIVNTPHPRDGNDRLSYYRPTIPFILKNMTWDKQIERLIETAPRQKEDEIQPDSLTLVSVLIDIGRGELESFQRSFDEYLERTRGFLQYKFPKVLYLDSRRTKQFEPYQASVVGKLKIIPFHPDDIARNLPYFDQIQAIRRDPNWYSQANWLSQSPQAKLKLYNPLVMSKVALTRFVAELNPFDTDAFLFVDAGHLCHNPQDTWWSVPQRFLASDKFFMSGFDYEPHGEIHGFAETAFRGFTRKTTGSVAVGRGGVLGGTLRALQLVDGVLDVISRETLSRGYMGTEESLFSILYYRWPELVHYVDNGNRGNCAPFTSFAEMDGPVNLRGLECASEIDGSIVCFHSNRTQYCGPNITPKYLTIAEDQRCDVDHFCRVQCYSDNTVKWSSHRRQLCEMMPGHCPPEPATKPSTWKPEPNVPHREVSACRRVAGGKWATLDYWKMSSFELQDLVSTPHQETATAVNQITALMLVMNTESELRAAAGTLSTYAAHGLLSGVGEFILWINNWGDDRSVPAMIEPFVRQYSLEVTGSKTNVGQTRAINTMVHFASNDYVLFLEKDFRLIEPWPCVVEQLTTGIDFLASKQANLVKYRHRWRPGHPNWAAIMFRGNEDKVMKQQRNLMCYLYHWIDAPETRYPDHFSKCNESPYMYCSDARDCGFTLNPILMTRQFWEEEYVLHFSNWQNHDPNHNLEFFMNWEPGAWNDRGWIVAQGEGLFQHEDKEKYGA